MNDPAAPDAALASFEEHRRQMFGIAYRMLGSITDAEDVLQDAWLAWSARDTVSVSQPGAYLRRMVTNLCLNRLTSAAARRESYVGPWLPEPLVTPEDNAADDAERAEDISLAMLVVLETLSPTERAVFVLKEVFGFSLREIAGVLDRNEAAVRQLASRARAHVRARRPRYDAPAAVRRRVTDTFVSACLGGDLNQMMELLAPDVTAWTDGGGKIRAALRPLHGADHVARWILGILAKPIPDLDVRHVLVNGQPGLLVASAGVPDSVVVADVTADGHIDAIRLIRNPDKLRHVGSATPTDERL